MDQSGEDSRGVGRSVERAWAKHTVIAQHHHESERFPVNMPHLGDQPLANPAAAVMAGSQARDSYRSAISLTGIDLILRAAATPTLRAYRSAISLTGITYARPARPSTNFARFSLSPELSLANRTTADRL
jgi:hypothetical protein